MAKRVLILDIDHTLIEGSSWINLTKALGSSVTQHLQIFNLLRKDEIPIAEAKSSLIKLWRLNSKLEFSELMVKIDNSIIFVDGVLELISLIKNYDLHVVLISGGFDLYVNALSKKINAHKSYAGSKFIFDQNQKLVDIDFILDQESFKLAVMNSLKKDIDLTNSISIGDGDTDRYVFANTDFALQVGNYVSTVHQPHVIQVQTFNAAVALMQNILRT